METRTQRNPATRRTFWAVTVFYVLIAFEFLYMATPFALYFYSIYKPGIQLTTKISALGWLGSFFLPHLVIETSSPLLNMRNGIGGILTVIGFTGFFFGAIQTYYSKLTQKGVVTRGIYKIIRHPQYASLILCSFGLLILWPRYLVLLSFIAMTFVYYFLAKLEEKECEEKFGTKYIEYAQQTGMFLPHFFHYKNEFVFLPTRGYKRILAVLLTFTLIATLSVLCADILKRWSLNNLYSALDDTSVTISLTKMKTEKIQSVMKNIFADPRIQEQLKILSADKNSVYLNYIIPLDYFALEIPMIPLAQRGSYHFLQRAYALDTCKIILTSVKETEPNMPSNKILMYASLKKPLIEVWYDMNDNKILNIISLAAQTDFIDIPVPLF